MGNEFFIQNESRIPKNFDYYSDNSDEEEKGPSIKQEEDFYNTPYSSMMRPNEPGMMGMGMMSDLRDYNMMNIKQDPYMNSRHPESQSQNR